MNTKFLHLLILLLINSVGYSQVEIRTEDGTYNLDKASSDFIFGKISYESYKYIEPDEYKKDRIRAIELITSSAESGYAEAQYYLGTIYLHDTLLYDYNKAIELLKKSAYQSNTDAIKLLDKLGEEYEVPLNYDLIIKVTTTGLLVLIYLVLSLTVNRKIMNSKYITQNHKNRLRKLTWLFPYIGALIGLNKHNKIIVPLDKDNIEWLNKSFNWIESAFGKETLLNSEIIIPHINKIPIKISQTENCAKELVSFVASKMKIKRDLIDVKFYNQSSMELDTYLVTQLNDEDKLSSGQYLGKSKKGKYQILLETSKLKNPIALIATIAHELAHIKLLGEKRIKKNDELLTDLIPIIFGFGIFNANSIFQYQQDSSGWRINSQGYLNEKMYGFALAKFALYRQDSKTEWSIYLTSTVKEEFEKSIIYL